MREQNLKTFDETQEPLALLLDRQLSGVTFVRDYLQFQFDDRGLTTITMPSLQTKDDKYLPGTLGYRDALCSLIGHLVVEVQLKRTRHAAATV